MGNVHRKWAAKANEDEIIRNGTRGGRNYKNIYLHHHHHHRLQISSGVDCKDLITFGLLPFSLLPPTYNWGPKEVRLRICCRCLPWSSAGNVSIESEVCGNVWFYVVWGCRLVSNYTPFNKQIPVQWSTLSPVQHHQKRLRRVWIKSLNEVVTEVGDEDHSEKEMV